MKIMFVVVISLRVEFILFFGILGYYDLCIFKIVIEDFVFGDDIV